MCGIFAYTGPERNVGELIFSGLKELEYRGYDSWGIAVCANRELELVKEVGKLPIQAPNMKRATIGLGHTRWATTGRVNRMNAHPHLDSDRSLALIHNGVVENYEELRDDVIFSGGTLFSETDSEVIAALIARQRDLHQLSLEEALRRVFQRLRGLNAVVVCDPRTLELAAAKNGSPLYLGLGEESYFMSSDVSSFLSYTDKMIAVLDGELVSLKDGKLRLSAIKNGDEISPAIERIQWTRTDASLGNYRHFLEKELSEQPAILRRIAEKDAEGHESIRELLSAPKIWFVGCGTAFHAGLTAQYVLSEIQGKDSQAKLAHEFEGFAKVLRAEDTVVALSQSGETIDVLEAVQVARKAGTKVGALVNVPGSTLTREADEVLLIGAGPEKCVLSTKAYSATVAHLYTLLRTADWNAKQVLLDAAAEMDRQLEYPTRREIVRVAREIQLMKSIFLLGNGACYPLALEGALKIKEVSYMHAEGFASGELKHGVIALIEQGTPCIVFAPEGLESRSLVSAQQVKARGAMVIGVGPENHECFDFHFEVRAQGFAFVLAALIPLQALAYELALLRGCDPDKPRNLAKSVTVR